MHKLVIYVHARNDVIRPATVEIKVDLPITSGIVLNNTASELAAQIEKEFPLSRVREVATSLIPLLRQAETISDVWLAGVVIKVPGTIEERAARTDTSQFNTATVQSQLDQMQQRYEDQVLNARNKAIHLEIELDKALQKEKVLLARVERLQASEKRLRTLAEENQSVRLVAEEGDDPQAEPLRKQIAELAENKGKLEVQLGLAQSQVTQAEQKAESLKVDLEGQLRMARFQAEGLKKELDQLHQTNNLLTDETKNLRRQLDKQQEAPKTVSQESQPASGTSSAVSW